ncbi:MAG: MFS transporter, partial [Candidatus Omnitrophota bacterium]
QMTAQSWLVFQLTNSSFLLGLVGFFNTIPVFLFSLFAGVIADRFNKKNIMILTQFSFMILAFILAILTSFGIINVKQLVIISLLNGFVMAFDAPARQSMVVELVGKNHLLNAIALNSAAFNSARIIGPALAGILVSVIGMAGCFYLNGISFLAVIIALLSIKLNYNKSTQLTQNNFWKDLLNGLNFIKNNKIIFTLVLMAGILSLFGVSYAILMPVFVKSIFSSGIKLLGVFMSAAGIGALIGALSLAKLGDFKFKGKFLVVTVFVFSLSLVLFSFSKNLILSLLYLTLIGWSSVASMSLINTLLQINVHDEYRGRVMSAFMLTFAGFIPFGNLLAGSLAQFFGASLAISFGAIACFISFSILIISNKDIINL